MQGSASHPEWKGRSEILGRFSDSPTAYSKLQLGAGFFHGPSVNGKLGRQGRQ